MNERFLGRVLLHTHFLLADGSASLCDCVHSGASCKREVRRGMLDDIFMLLGAIVGVFAVLPLVLLLSWLVSRIVA